MEGSEDVAFVFGWKLVTGIKTEVERSRVCLYEHIGNDDLIGELGMLSLVMRILMISDVIPRPSIKTPTTHTADVVGWQIFADFVPLICAHPKLVCAWPKRDADGVANSPCVNLLPSAVRIKLEDACTIFFRSVIRHIRA